jgi:pilus assembly protein FimV
VRDSSAASPQRDYRAANTGPLAPGSRYTINKDQTLWDIASRAKPAGATVHQTMLEIQRLNPDAFINGNINRIKAGYTIYLPNAGDITSTDMSATLAEVNEQNAAWREGRDAQLNSTKRASLRISADPEESAVIDSAKTTTLPATGAPLAEGADTPSASSVAAESANTASADSKDPQERLAAIEEQLASLQRIVSLKDDQIASLQGELAKAGVATTDTGTTIGTTTGTAPVTAGNGDAPVTAAIPDVSDETATAEDTANSGAGSVSEGAPKTEIQEPTSPEVPQAVPSGAPESVSDSGWMNYLVYVLGALALGLAGLVIAKRRGSQTPAAVPARKVASKEDVFDDIKLRDQRIKPDTPEKDLDDSETETVLGTRGYGERKHDQYASDIDAADVLAEADIYIAYGRHQQAIDLLNNAIAAEPGSSVCRLKLLEIYTELNDHAAATSQMLKIKANGDPDSIERAESLIKRLRDEGQPETQTEFVRKPAGNGPGLTPNPLKMMEDSKKTHEVDFSGLEIEGVGASVEDDDLDLSGDFGVASADRFEDEELVIAADSNGLSTKLDLARAYLDMGDDDGARQILDEVVMEGSEELKAQARALLDRIG